MTDGTAGPPLLELREATVMRGEHVALDRISLTLRTDQNTAIIGPNGSGKSTLIQLLTSQLYPLARNGVAPCRILGRERWNVEALRSHVGVISSDLHQRYVAGSSLGHTRALEAVIASFFGSEVVFGHRTVTEAMREQALEALERAGAAHLADARLDRVSTGEARRILIARALVHRPDVLVLDEPTTGLDPVARHDLLERLREMARAGTSVVLITHHLEEVIPEIGRAILLNDGRVLADGTPDETLTSASVSRAFGRPLQVEHRDGRYGLRFPDPRATTEESP